MVGVQGFDESKRSTPSYNYSGENNNVPTE
ncbi:hypothetical protein ALT1545_90086 [Alteromonas macleodii]